MSDREDDSEFDEPQTKNKKRVSFSDEDSDEDKSRKAKRSKHSHKSKAAPDEPVEVNTLEDLEALATGLLG